MFRAGIDGRRRIVEQQDGWLQQQGPRDGQPLALAAGQVRCPFAEHGLVALRQTRDEIVRLSQSRRALDLRLRRARLAEGDVGGDGVRKQETFLEDEADVAPQIVEFDAARIVAVDQDPALARVVETRDQTQQRAFARAGRPEDRHARARVDVEIHPAQDAVLADVVEVDVLEAHVAPRPWQPHEAVRLGVGDLHRRVEHLEHPPRPGQAGLDAVGDVRNFEHLVGELLEQPREHHQPRTERKFAPDHERAAVSQQHDEIDLAQKTQRRDEGAQPPENPALLIAHLAVGGGELLDFLPFARKSLDHLRALDVLAQTRR